MLEQPNIFLHPSFSIKDCTFLSGEKGVIYSPVNGETLLCDPSIIHFLIQLESEPESSHVQLVKAHPTRAADIIKQLASLYVIEIQG